MNGLRDKEGRVEGASDRVKSKRNGVKKDGW